MKKNPSVEIAFAMLALGLIYVIVSSNASITGFVIGPPVTVTLVSPTDNTQTKATSFYFIFKYPPELIMKECASLINGKVARTANSMLSPYDTRISAELKPGIYTWSIECTDSTDSKFISDTRNLVILGETDNSGLKVVKFSGTAGYLYQFELKPGLEMKITKVVPNDIISIKYNGKTYDLNILKMAQDYTQNIEFLELIADPGVTRMKINQGESVLLDLDGDSLDDVKLTLDDISAGKASFTFRTRTEEENLAQTQTLGTPEIQEPSIMVSPLSDAARKGNTPGAALAQEYAKKGGSSLLELFLIGMVVVLVIAIVSTIKHKVRAGKDYLSELSNKTTAKPKSAPNKGIKGKSRKKK